MYSKLLFFTIIISGMLDNAETLISITEADITNLTMPDTMLQRLLLSSPENPSYVFMSFERCHQIFTCAHPTHR